MKAYGALAAAMLVATSAFADVKTGVDAWDRGDFTTAVAEWRGLAVAGDPDAQFNLAQAYKLGRGVPIDQAMAESWYRKAAAQGHAQAQDNLGLILFQQGKKAEALPWLEKSVVRDERRTELVLGTMLFNGDAVTKDWPRAYALVTRASQQGLPQASQTLAQMDAYITPEDKQKGLRLAAQIAQTAKLAAVQAPSPARPSPSRASPTRPAPIRTADVAPSSAQTSPAVRPAPKPTPKPAAARPAPVVAGPAPARGGAWRIQLGAFGDEGNARKLWAQVGRRTGGSAAFVKAGGITRLQATGFASKAAAQAACARAKVSCVVVAP
jgi:cell division septation protein DedD